MLAQAKNSQKPTKRNQNKTPTNQNTDKSPKFGRRGFPLKVIKKLRGTIKGKHTYPPLLVLFTGYNNYFSFNKRELIIIICLTVINGLHSPHFVFPLKTEWSFRWRTRGTLKTYILYEFCLLMMFCFTTRRSLSNCFPCNWGHKI